MNSPNPTWKPGDKIPVPGGAHIQLDPQQLDTQSMYKLIIGSVVPRPIAFVSTISSAGVGNLAPFSFFNGVSSNPPCLMFSIGRRPTGEKKDTLRNIEETGEFVVNSANEWLVEALVHCAADFPYGTDELKKVGLTEIPSQRVKPVRVKESAIQFECKVYQSVQVGDGSAGSSTVIIGQIVMVHILERAYNDGKVILDELKPVARLGGINYALLGRSFGIPVPKV